MGEEVTALLAALPLGMSDPVDVWRVEGRGLLLPRGVFGTCPQERVCVTLALEWLGGDLDTLLALRDEMRPDGACPLVPQFGIAPVGTGT